MREAGGGSPPDKGRMSVEFDPDGAGHETEEVAHQCRLTFSVSEFIFLPLFCTWCDVTGPLRSGAVSCVDECAGRLAISQAVNGSAVTRNGIRGSPFVPLPVANPIWCRIARAPGWPSEKRTGTRCQCGSCFVVLSIIEGFHVDKNSAVQRALLYCRSEHVSKASPR